MVPSVAGMTIPAMDALLIERAEGCTLYAADGLAYLDGASCAVHGHGHPRIDAALRGQLERVVHVCASGVSHPLVTALAGALVAAAPPGFARVAFARDAAEALELAAALRPARRGAPLRIADETAIVPGRTGTLFGCEQKDPPDVLVLADGLTAGYMPLGAVLTTAAVAPGPAGIVPEPLACAAALASLEVFDAEATLERVRPKIALLASLLAEHVEPLGLARGIEGHGLSARIAVADPAAVAAAARRHGAVVGVDDHAVRLAPPLSITPAELERLVTATAAAIAEGAGDTGEGDLPLAA